jgi:hypothetical protein
VNLGDPRLSAADGKKNSGREVLFYKATKWKETSRESDEIIVLKIVMQQNITGGKGLC